VKHAITPAQLARLFEQSKAARWDLSADQFSATLEASVEHAFANRSSSSQDIDRHFASLHLDDLALASACAAGLDAAWEHFVHEYRPVLYRSADAIDPTGGARDLADALYADLFGLKERGGVRQSLFRYFHGRSSLSTWLRAVLAQRHVDRLRSGRRLDPLPDDDFTGDGSATHASRQNAVPDPERPRHVETMRLALAAAIASLEPRDRLRLGCYYAQDLTLAAIGRMLGEHEATVSRHLTRTRRLIREAVEGRLRREHRFDDRALSECFQSVADDPGSIDLQKLIGRKDDEQDRSR
jgi:RNA polymerase sigma-70 factor, ECF subfamily